MRIRHTILKPRSVAQYAAKVWLNQPSGEVMPHDHEGLVFFHVPARS